MRSFLTTIMDYGTSAGSEEQDTQAEPNSHCDEMLCTIEDGPGQAKGE